MTMKGLATAISGVSRRWLGPPSMRQDGDGEYGRARLRGRLMLDDRLLRDIGFREEVSRFHRNRFPGM